MHKKLKEALALYRYFFRIGWYTFGGGWSIVAQIEKDYVDARKEMTAEELLDMVSVGRSLPGLMIGNVSYLFGCRRAGALGGVFSVLGISTAPFFLLSVLTVGYHAVKDNVLVGRMLTGVRCVVAPVIFSAAWKLRKGAFPRPVCWLLCAAAFFAVAVLHLGSVTVVLLGAAAGLVLETLRKGGAGPC